VEGLAERLQRLFALDYSELVSAGELARSAEARAAYQRDPEGYLAELRTALVTYAAAREAVGDPRP
jgi:hypothetical protein